MKRVLRREPTRRDAGLLRRLSGNPAFATYIRQLPAATVVRLIDDVGLEDSQELLAAMDAQQLRETMSIALWSSDTTGHDEALDIDQFVRWIALWLGEGDQTWTRRAIELGEDFIVACLRQLLFAVDRTAVGVERRGVEIGNYVVFPKEQKHWPRIAEALVALWSHDPDFTLRSLRRCSHERTILNETRDEHDAQDSVLQDLTAERGAARAQVGHVSAMHAALFLSMTKTASLKALCAQTEYDLNTADYLAKAERAAREMKHGSINVEATESHSSEPPESSEARKSSESLASQSGAPPPQAGDFAALDELLREAGVLEANTEVPLLTNQSAPSGALYLERAITTLAALRPDIASRRMRELAYLANVLMAGAESQGRRYTATVAARTAMATANLGATFLLRDAAPRTADADRIPAMLEQDPGVVRLFQVGFNLLSRIPLLCCEAVYQAKDVQSRRRGHTVYMEMEEILGTSVLTDLVSEGHFPEAKSVIDELPVVMDSAACVALRVLVDPIPAYPNVLGEAGAEAATYVDRRHRPIESIEDLERIGSFLSSLANYCGP